ncbi:MAG TPA: Hsp20/alpha crystallin family protein [Bacteroidetes bacterium]|nr:Hsp20/alpha crystallin family protein [Bacteroidota bacterium]
MPSFDEQFQELEQLQERMRRFLDHLSRARFPQVQFAWATWSPAVDVYEVDEEYVVLIELPGVDPQRLRVVLEDRELRVSGEKVPVQRSAGARMHRLEIATGPFERVIRLPGPVAGDSARARYDRGVLEIRIPKGQARSATQRVEILDDF